MLCIDQVLLFSNGSHSTCSTDFKDSLANMRALGLYALFPFLVIFIRSLNCQAGEAARPGPKCIPLLPKNYSDDPSYWVHRTPLLQSVMSEHDTLEQSQLATRETVKGVHWHR